MFFAVIVVVLLFDYYVVGTNVTKIQLQSKFPLLSVYRSRWVIGITKTKPT